MNIVPQTSAAERAGAAPLATRAGTVVLGRQDFFSVLLRLIGMELYKIRRRAMSKVLGSIAFTLAVLVFLLLSVGTIFVASRPAKSFAPDCSTVSAADCPRYTDAQLEQLKQSALEGISEPLRLPSSIAFAAAGVINPSTILIIILVGAMAGGEYSVGTVRLLFTRGPMRGQFLLAKYGAALFCIVVGVLGIMLLSVITGELLNPISGVAQSFDFFSAAWVGHLALYLLAVMLNWAMYAVIAIFFSTLGRSTVAGIVGGITWFFGEPLLSGAFNLMALFNRGPFGDFLKAIPDYLINNNVSALQLNQAQYVFNTNPSSLSDLHAILVLLVYLAAFVGLTWWLNESRDVTN